MLRAFLVLFVAVVVLPIPVLPQAPLRVDVDLTNVSFSVTDRMGRFVSGLKQDDFAIEEDGRKQEITRFSRENELPLTIGMLIDKSPSVGRVFGDERATAISFLDATLRNSDLAMVISFDRTVTLEEDFTDSKRALRRAINGVTIGNGTSVFDAIYLACNDQLKKETGRKAIILISDGQDTTSKVRINEALIAAQQSEAVIYSISNRIGGFFDDHGSGDPETLRRFSLETGGTVYFVSGRSDMTEVFSQIADELRSQYTLAYSSSNSARDGKFRKIRIVTKDSTYKVKARQGYYAPSS
jgi:Ca-activated chloride channel family protein